MIRDFAPSLAARRRCLQLLGSREAVEILFDDLAPRFSDRDGGYTRVLRLAQPRLGDAGNQAILELVGVRDRVVEKSEKPEFSDEEPEEEAAEATADAAESDAGSDDAAADDAVATAEDAAAEEGDQQEEEEK